MAGTVDDAIASITAETSARGRARAFGVCGSGASLRLAEALDAASTPFLSVGHEAVATLMAGGVALGDGFGVSVTIKGPGLANALPGILHNRLERLPTLSISEAFGADAPAARQHKRLDHAGLLAGADVAHLDLDDVDGPDALGRRMQLAALEPRRPVHLDLAAGTGRPEPVVSEQRLPSGVPDAVRRTIAAASRPVVVAGGLARRRGWRDALAALEVPVFTTVAAKGLLDESSPWSAGVLTGAGLEATAEAVLMARADLVIGLGLRAEELLGPLAGDRPVVYVDEVDLPRPGPGTLVVDRTGAVAGELLAGLAASDWDQADVGRAGSSARDLLLGGGWGPARAIEVASSTLGDHVLVCDTGEFCTVAEHVWQAGPGRPFVASANSRYMGTSLPLAMGYAMARPEAPVVCAVGDGGICSYPTELRHAADLGLRLCVLVMRDHRYTSVLRQQGDPGRAGPLVRTPSHSWVAVAEAVGVPGTAVADADGLAAALSGWSDGPLLVEVALPPESPHGIEAIR